MSRNRPSPVLANSWFRSAYGAQNGGRPGTSPRSPAAGAGPPPPPEPGAGGGAHAAPRAAVLDRPRARGPAARGRRPGVGEQLGRHAPPVVRRAEVAGPALPGAIHAGVVVEVV